MRTLREAPAHERRIERVIHHAVGLVGGFPDRQVQLERLRQRQILQHRNIQLAVTLHDLRRSRVGIAVVGKLLVIEHRIVGQVVVVGNVLATIFHAYRGSDRSCPPALEHIAVGIERRRLLRVDDVIHQWPVRKCKGCRLLRIEGAWSRAEQIQRRAPGNRSATDGWIGRRIVGQRRIGQHRIRGQCEIDTRLIVQQNAVRLVMAILHIAIPAPAPGQLTLQSRGDTPGVVLGRIRLRREVVAGAVEIAAGRNRRGHGWIEKRIVRRYERPRRTGLGQIRAGFPSSVGAFRKPLQFIREVVIRVREERVMLHLREQNRAVVNPHTRAVAAHPRSLTEWSSIQARIER